MPLRSSCLLPLLLASAIASGQEPPADQADVDAATVAAVEADTPSRPLDQLAWMVGDWVDEAGSDRVNVTCRWTKNEQFITRRFSVVDDAGDVLLEGGQVIGWDPVQGRIRSWTFDSEGGFGESYWTRDGDRWLIKATFTQSTGNSASAVNIFTRIDDNTASWASVNREVAGQLQPNQPPVTVVRVATDEDSADHQEVSE